MAEHFGFFFENILLISIAFIRGSSRLAFVNQKHRCKKTGHGRSDNYVKSAKWHLIDLREDDDLSGGIIPQAERIPSSILLKKREEFDKHKKISG